MTEIDENVIVIDNGSGLIKAGFSGEDAPRSVFSSIVGHSKSKDTYDNRGVSNALFTTSSTSTITT